jgi:WD40 repeat protein
VAFSTDGKRVLTGSLDQTVRLWDVRTGKQLAAFEGHKSCVSKVAFSPDGAYAISGGWDKTARQWKLPD